MTAKFRRASPKVHQFVFRKLPLMMDSWQFIDSWVLARAHWDKFFWEKWWFDSVTCHACFRNDVDAWTQIYLIKSAPESSEEAILVNIIFLCIFWPDFLIGQGIQKMARGKFWEISSWWSVDDLEQICRASMIDSHGLAYKLLNFGARRLKKNNTLIMMDFRFIHSKWEF